MKIMSFLIFFLLLNTRLQANDCTVHLDAFERALANQREIKHSLFGATLNELLIENFELTEASSLLQALSTSSQQSRDITRLMSGNSAKYLKKITRKCDDINDEDDKQDCSEELLEIIKEDYVEKKQELIDERSEVIAKVNKIKERDDYISLERTAKFHALKFLIKKCHTDNSYTLYEIKEYGCHKSVPPVSEDALALASDVADAVVVTQTQPSETAITTSRTTTTVTSTSTTPLECPSGTEIIENKCYTKCPDLYLRDPADMKCVPDVEAQYAENQRIIENRKSWSKVAKIGGIVLAAGGAIGLAAWGISAIVDAENNAGGGSYTPTTYYNPYAGGYSSYYPGYSTSYYNPYMYSYPSWVGSQHNASNTPYSFEF